MDAEMWLDAARKLTAMVIGEPILDEYVYVEPQGKTPKDNLITYVRTGETDTYDGGAWVVTAHLSQACASARLGGNIGQFSPVLKSRRVQKAFNTKLFSEAIVPSWKHCNLAGAFDSDFTVVTDFGHGLIPELVEPAVIRRESRWYALTVQANSLNFGFNTLRKWYGHKPDYVVVDETEARLATGLRFAPIEQVAGRLTAELRPRKLAITRGHQGVYVTNGGAPVCHPALATAVLDRMGAGDAFLAWTAPLAYLDAPLDVIARVGSVAAALKVGKRGNQVVTQAEVREMLK